MASGTIYFMNFCQHDVDNCTEKLLIHHLERKKEKKKAVVLLYTEDADYTDITNPQSVLMCA